MGDAFDAAKELVKSNLLRSHFGNDCDLTVKTHFGHRKYENRAIAQNFGPLAHEILRKILVFLRWEINCD